MINANKKFKKIAIICVVIFILAMNVFGQVFWRNIIISKEILLFFTVTTLISQVTLLILVENIIFLKIGFYYWIYVLIMNAAMTMYLYSRVDGIVRSLSEFFLFFRARTFWLFSTSELLYLPGFNALGGLISKENLFTLSVFIFFIVSYRLKIKKVAMVTP